MANCDGKRVVKGPLSTITTIITIIVRSEISFLIFIMVGRAAPVLLFYLQRASPFPSPHMAPTEYHATDLFAVLVPT